MHNAALCTVPDLESVHQAQQHTHDALYQGTDMGRLMRRPPGVHWTMHTGASDIAEAAAAVYGHEGDPEAQDMLARIVEGVIEYPMAVLVVGHAIVRRVDPRLN